MSDLPQFVYSNSDPEAVGAFQAAGEAYVAAQRRIIADAVALPNVKAATTWEASAFGDKARVTGLAPIDLADGPPEGWRYLKSRKRFEPAKGEAGAAARAWLLDHQIPDEADARGVMAARGLPKFVEYGGRTGLVFSTPAVEVLGGVLWARFEGGDPSGCTWERRRLSEYYAAKEAAEDAKVGEVSAR